MKKYITWAELNFFLMFAGFPLLVTFFQNSAISIAYRGFALLVALQTCASYAGRKNRRPPHSSLMSVFMGLYFLINVLCLWDLFLGHYSDTPYIASRNMAALFVVGVSFFPVLGVYYSFNSIRWERLLLILFYTYFFILGYAQLRGYVEDSGRAGISSHMGTLGLGETGVYLVLVSAVLLRIRDTAKKEKLKKMVFILGLILGFVAIFRAASRGPFIGIIAGLSYFFMSGGKWNKTLTIIIIIAMIGFSAFTETLFSKVAPVLYDRMVYTIDNEDTGGRDVLYEEAIKTIRENPLTGGVSIALEPNSISNCHNLYLDTTLELGVLGGLTFVIICLYLLVWCLKIPQDYMNQPTTLFFSSLFIFCLVRGMSGLSLSMGANVVVAFTGLIYCKENYDYSIVRNNTIK